MTEMRLVYIGLGSNLPVREQHLASALRGLDGLIDTQLLRVSPVYESDPWGDADQGAYLNAVAELHTARSPEELLLELQRLELASGRERSDRRWGPRQLDLDLLWFEGEQRSGVALDLPHPRAQHRSFVLRPWADLAPSLQLAGRSLQDCLSALKDHCGIRPGPQFDWRGVPA